MTSHVEPKRVEFIDTGRITTGKAGMVEWGAVKEMVSSFSISYAFL